MDILDHFEADIDALHALIIELQLAEENSQEEANAYLALVSLVKQRDSAQEQLFHSLSNSQALSPQLKKAIDRSLDRAAGARSVESMIECCTNRATWRSSVRVYCELLSVRIDQEKKCLLTSLYDHMTPREREKLGREYSKLRRFSNKNPDRIDWRKIWATIIDRAG